MSLMNPELVVSIICDAGGEVVGRTRLQKIAYLLEIAGLGDGFHFTYKHFGPFSYGVADSARMGTFLGTIVEEKKEADWGGIYSIYRVKCRTNNCVHHGRRELASRVVYEDTIVLELATTAIYFSRDGYGKPWSEIERRKPEKVKHRRLERAKDLLAELRQIDVPIPLPEIV